MKIFRSAQFLTENKGEAYLIVGLGNPGKEYECTRHNVGFTCIDYLSSVYDIPVSKIKFKGLLGEGKIAGKKCFLLKPQTYMNLSGESVREAVGYFKIPIENVIIIYDDISLETGKIRVRGKGSDGGHKGMASIIYQLQTDKITRVKIGVGHPDGDVKDFVLGTFSSDDDKVMTDSVKKTDSIVETLIKSGVDVAMNKFNGEKAKNNDK